MALETPMVQADVVEAQEFPHLSRALGVRAVPKTVINGQREVLGAVNERTLLQHILSAVGQEDLLETGSAQPAPDASGGATTALGG